MKACQQSTNSNQLRPYFLSGAVYIPPQSTERWLATLPFTEQAHQHVMSLLRQVIADREGLRLVDLDVLVGLTPYFSAMDCVDYAT